MRIVTRPDFDGIVCAVLLYEAEKITAPVLWIEPSAIQKNQVDIEAEDILANLPYRAPAAMWFDHHFSNRLESSEIKGLFRIAPSAAGLIFEYYRDRFTRDFRELAAQADKIDAADLTLEEVRCPENHPYILLSMTISGRDPADEPFWNRLVELLRRREIQDVMADPEVARRCERVVDQNRRYEGVLKAHTRIEGQVAITDFRGMDHPPNGNRFLVYSLFPDTVVQVKIRMDDRDATRIGVSVGHSIFNRKCRVNVGQLLSEFEGGGHRGAGACRFHQSKADDYIPRIIDTLIQNRSNEE
jgi:hypothetical protein